MFISLYTLVNSFLLLAFSKISAQTGAPYRRSGCIPPVYSVFKALWLSLQFSFADFERANIIFLHFSVTCVMCSLNVSLSSIIPRYFKVLTWLSCLLFKYTSRSFLSYLFRRVISITFDFLSLKQTLFSFTHVDTFFISVLVMFSTSLTDFPLVSNTRSSANATILVPLVNVRFNSEL